MRLATACALVALFVVGCGPSDAASTPRTIGSPSASLPLPATMATKLNCDSHIGATALAIYRYATTSPFVELLDVSNPVRPSLVCTLMPAYGAHILSDTKLAFWSGDQLGIVDLTSGAPITQTARLAASAGTGAFSPDGVKFAYRSHNDAGGMSLHLYAGGSDRTLYVQQPIGGHDGPGPSVGPTDRLQFSADGSLLLDEFSFRPPSGPANFIVFKSDGSIAFQSTAATGGTWSPSGHTLYFIVHNQPGPTGELHSLTADGQQHIVATGLDGLFWSRMSPDGSGIIYNAIDSSVPDCGGLPHLWRVDLTTGHAAQISKSISSGPFFVQPTVVWSDEQVLTQCGPGGPSSEDGVILAHDLITGKDTTVDTTLMVPGIGGQPLPPPATWNLLDSWFAK